MKTTRIFKLMGIVLMGLVLTAQVEAIESSILPKEKKAITLTVDKPFIEFMAKAYADRIDADDIMRMNKMTGQIDHLAVSFKDADASDYIFRFKTLDEKGLESWMFSEGYLTSPVENVSAVTQEMTVRVDGIKKANHRSAKKAINLTVDKPIIEFLARIYADQIDAKDILRLQKLCCQIDHVTISFRDEDASDYVLSFKPLDKQGLEAWMFNEGYLISQPEPEPEMAGIEPWMLDFNYLE